MRDDWLVHLCASWPRVAAFNEHRLGPHLCFDARQRAAFLAARDFSEHKAKALPIIKARRHVYLIWPASLSG